MYDLAKNFRALCFTFRKSLCFAQCCDAANMFYLKDQQDQQTHSSLLHCSITQLFIRPNTVPLVFTSTSHNNAKHLHPQTAMYLTGSLSSLSLKAQCCWNPFSLYTDYCQVPYTIQTQNTELSL